MSIRRNLKSAFFLSASLAALCLAAPANAQPGTRAFSQASATETAVDNLVQGLVSKGVVSKKDARTLLDKFHSDLLQTTSSQPTPSQAAAPSPAEVPEAGVVRVPYISPAVRQQITEQVRSEVVQQAKDEHWATPNALPAWLGHIAFFGDLRLRDESRFFDRNNELAFVNVGAINAGSPYNAGSNNNVLPPILNSTKDRNLTNFRARFGLTDRIDDDFSITLRLGSGSDNSPVSTNQTLGQYFTKDSIWLDRAYFEYAPDIGFGKLLATAGRMPNPFVTTELVWDADVNLDGAAVRFDREILQDRTGDGFRVHATGGVFPLSYVPDAFPTNAISNQKSGQGATKWIYAGQIGADYTHSRLDLSFDAAYYSFQNVQGDLSPACSNEAAYCLTDASRPGFLQKGNTLFALRNLTFPNPSDVSQPQYYGVASKFEVLDLIGKADVRLTDALHLSFTGDYADNLGYDSKDIQALPIVNNNETCSVAVPTGQTCSGAGGTNVFKSGNQAWLGRIQIGHPAIEERWDWNASFTYEHIEPDAVLDAFNDSDFHLGGTNAKGWVIGASLGVFRNTALSAKWYSTDALYGPRFSEDTLQIDLLTHF